MALKRTEGFHVAAQAAARLIWQTGIGVVILIGLLGGRAALARELIWVTVEATAPVVSGDTKKARQQAILAAERQAVVEALAEGISVETLRKNFLSTNEHFIFPGSKDRNKGIKLIVHLPDKKTTTTESIYIKEGDQ